MLYEVITSGHAHGGERGPVRHQSFQLVLGKVADSGVGAADLLAGQGFELADQTLEQGRLAGTRNNFV